MIHRARNAAALLLLLTCTLGAGCGGDGSPAQTPTPTGTVAATVTGLPAPGPLPPALERIAGEVAALRGLPVPEGLRAAVIPPEQAPVLIASLLTDADRAWFARTTTLYRLLGFIGPEDDYLALYLGFTGPNVAGLYDPGNETLWVVERDGVAGLDGLSREEQTSIGHEFVHAMQDATFDLGALTGAAADDLDRALALTALIEGDAVAHERLYAARAVVPGGPLLLLAAAQGVPPAIDRELRFPYEDGARWVESLRGEGGTAAIDAAFANPPGTTAEILHAGALPDGWEPREVALPDLAEALGAGWTRESGGTLGEFQLRNTLQLGLRGLDAATAAEGWEGDAYAVWRQGDASALAVRIAFADESEAAAFADAWESLQAAQGAGGSGELADGRHARVTIVGGSGILLVIGTEKDAAERLMASLSGG